MIKFMVIGAPRSGTAWSSIWLTHGNTLCIHDPLWDYHYRALDGLNFGEREIGFACTGMALFHEWVNEHPCPKVVLRRDPKEVNESLRQAGFPPCPSAIFKGLDKIKGALQVQWTDIFRSPREIWEHLMIEPFDGTRHLHLARMNVTANVHTRSQNREVADLLLQEDAFNAAYGQ